MGLQTWYGKLQIQTEVHDTYDNANIIEPKYA